MKRKILIFIESLSGGGAEQVLVTMFRHFDYTKYDVTLLTVSDVGVHLDDIDFSKVHYKSVIPKHNGLLANFWYALKYKMIYQYLPAWIVARHIIPSGYDTYIAFVEGYTTKIISHVPSKYFKLAWVHCDLKKDSWTIKKGIYKSFQEEKTAYMKYNKVIAVSRNVEDIMKDYYSLTNTCTIYNPIDVEFISQMAKEPVCFTPSDGFNIVSVGRLVPQKGYDLLIPIIARLRNEGIDVSLYILGEGEDRQKLEALNLELGTTECVHLLGYHTNPHAIVSKMDAFVCSSRAEGYSLVIAEALSQGIPVISTNCLGPSELLGSDSRYGLLCRDYEDLYSKIKEVATKPVLLDELHEKALKKKLSLDVNTTMSQVYELLK